MGNKKMTDIKVKLIKQKYNEHASRGLEQELELIGLVSAVGFDKINDGKVYPYLNLKDAEEFLRAKAAEIGATHVFGVEYQFAQPENYLFRVYISGDAYKPKQNKDPYRG